MKLVRYGDAGAEKPGLVDAEGRLRNLSGTIGMGQEPPIYLRAGDVMELGFDGLGVQCQRVVADEAAE